MAIKGKFFSYWLFRSVGMWSDVVFDEYGVQIFDPSNVRRNIYLDKNPSELFDELMAMERQFRAFKYKSIYEIPFSLGFNRGYAVEHYFLRTIGKSVFHVKGKDQTQAFIIPAASNMYYTMVQMWRSLLQILGLKLNPKKTQNMSFLARGD